MNTLANTKIIKALYLCVIFGSLIFGITACDMPPMDSEQKGFRGVGMVEIDNPEDVAVVEAANQMPDLGLPILPVLEGSPKAGDVYENVEVLTDVTVPEFVGLMTAMAEWVAPEGQSCGYCHGEVFSDDGKYTKVVARRMLQMTRTINSEWRDHVGETGVNCYTCHRGEPVPEYVWFTGSDIPDTHGMAASRLGQNLSSETTAYSSLPYDPFSTLLNAKDGEARVASPVALPSGQTGDMRNTEHTYALMIHMSDALGVNCGHCHNSRAFWDWDQSNPARATAWYGIRMARQLNNEYLDPLKPVYPANRLGPQGDAPKANCATCHQGVVQPLYGASMINEYPALTAYINESNHLSDSMLAHTGTDSSPPQSTASE